MDSDRFRFSSKKEYEFEISKILAALEKLKSSKNNTKEIRKLDFKYEELLEEYLIFCGEFENKDVQ